jgi:hypothetical protein
MNDPTRNQNPYQDPTGKGFDFGPAYDGTHSPWGPLVYVALVLGIVAMLLGAFLMSVERIVSHPTESVASTPVALGSPSSPREQMGRLQVTDVTNTALVPAAYTTPASGFCVTNSATDNVFVVAETAADTTDGDGPYCTDTAACPAGPVIPIAGRAWARLDAAGLVTLSCRWVDDGTGYGAARSLGGGGGGGPAACELTGGADCTMLGQIITVPGSVSTPAFRPNNDSDTGMIMGAGTVGLVTNGVNRWSMSTALINSTLPINSSNGTDAAPSFAGNSTNSDTGFYTGGTDQARISASGVTRLTVTPTGVVSTVPIQGPNGSLASPSFSFSTDADSGMSYSATGVGTVQLGNNTGDAAMVSTNSDVTLLSGDDTFITVGDDLNVLATGGTGNVDLHAMGALIVPLYINAGVTTLPPCAAAGAGGDGGEGKMIYRDDTSDLVVGQPCFCVANALRTVFSWTNLGGGVCAP